MNTAALTRDPFMPRRPRGTRRSLALALLAHALLIAGLAFSVDWHTTEPNAVEAELWSAVPRQAAPRQVAPEPSRPEVRPAAAPPPPPPVRPQPVQPPQVDPQIAIEKARKVEAQRDQAAEEQARRNKARQEQQARQAQVAKEDQARRQALAEQADKTEANKEKAEREKAEREKADKAKADKAKADKAVAAAREAAARDAYLKRMQGLAGASGDSTSTGTAAKSSGPSSGYAGRIMARIKPNIVFSDAVDGNPTASVEVKVAPDGTITGRRLVQGSGVKAWDDAVLRAIDRTDGLPRDIDGRVQPLMLITFKRE